MGAGQGECGQVVAVYSSAGFVRVRADTLRGGLRVRACVLRCKFNFMLYDNFFVCYLYMAQLPYQSENLYN